MSGLRPGRRALFLTSCAVVLWFSFSSGPSACGQASRTMGLQLGDDSMVEKVRQFESEAAAENWVRVASLAQELIEGEYAALAAVSSPPKSDDADEERPFQAVEAAQRLYSDGREKGLHLSVRDYITRRLVNLPGAALTRYREVREPAAEDAWRMAMRSGAESSLVSLHRRYGATDHGLSALHRLVFLALEQGRFSLASRRAQDYLDLAWKPALSGGRQAGVLSALAMAAAESGNPFAMDAWKSDATTHAETVVRIGGESVKLGLWWERCRARAADRSDRQGPTGQSKLDLRWSVELAPAPKRLEPLRPEPSLHDDKLAFHTRREVALLDFETGDIHWRHDLKELGAAAGSPFDLSCHGALIRSLAGCLSRDSYAFVTESKRDDTRQLVVLNSADGSIRWGRHESGGSSSLPAIRFDPNLLIHEGVLYLTAHEGEGTPHSWVIAADVATGELLWRTKIPGGVALSYRARDGEFLPAEAWLGSTPLTLSDGILYVANNLGSFVALECDTGRARFLYRYPRRQVASHNRFEAGVLDRGWTDNPVFAQGEHIALAPDDADDAFYFFVRPPRDARRRALNEVWQLADRRPRDGMSQILGLDGGVAWLTGVDRASGWTTVRAEAPFGNRNSLQVWAASAPLESRILGRGIVGIKNVYVCSHKYVYSIARGSGISGKPRLSHEADGARRLGNLLLRSGCLVVGSHAAITCYDNKK